MNRHCNVPVCTSAIINSGILRAESPVPAQLNSDHVLSWFFNELFVTITTNLLFTTSNGIREFLTWKIVSML